MYKNRKQASKQTNKQTDKQTKQNKTYIAAVEIEEQARVSKITIL